MGLFLNASELARTAIREYLKSVVAEKKTKGEIPPIEPSNTIYVPQGDGTFREYHLSSVGKENGLSDNHF